MARDVRIRNVPDKAHQQLVAAAAALGFSLEEYLLQALRQLAGDKPQGRRPPRRDVEKRRSEFYEQAAMECLSTLGEAEARIIKLRLGIGDVEPHNLQEIADVLGVSRQRVHQIETDALRKLNHPARLEVLAFAMRKLRFHDRESR